MIRTAPSSLRRFAPALSLTLAALCAMPAALAQDAVVPAGPTANVVVNLIRLMVQRGLLTQADADALIHQAEAEAQQAAAAPPVIAQPPTDLAPGSVFVPYVPQVVKDEIREQLKLDVMAKARAEKWASPDSAPDWTRRITLSGDIRFRDEYQLFDQGNAPDFIDFAAFNSEGPYDINAGTNPVPPVTLNTTEDRNGLLRLRARLALGITLADEASVGIRLATGSSDSPVSTNQTLGGGFSKKQIWLDRAWLDLHPWPWGRALLGRMPNPFVSTDLIYDEDLNFDGVATKLNGLISEDWRLSAFGTFGGFPLEYGRDNFPKTSVSKNSGPTKWLIGSQIGLDWKTSEERDDHLKASLAYYDFQHIRGRTSEPCALFDGGRDCSSDPSIPPFLQKGNTLFLIRDIVGDPANPDNFRQPQFAGLTFDYNVLDLSLQYDRELPASFRHLMVQADAVRNLDYKRSRAFRNAATEDDDPVNNYANGPSPDVLGRYESGGDGWLLRTVLGDPVASFPGAWNAGLSYKYLEADAVLDALTDSDFHLGGTNAKGLILSGSYGLFRNTWISARWFSANEIDGPPLSIDVLQFDLNAKF